MLNNNGTDSENDVPYEVQIFIQWIRGTLPVASPTLLDARTAQIIELIRRECVLNGDIKE